MAQPRRMPMAELSAKMRELNALGLSHKQLASRLGYSYDYIRELCSRWGIFRRKPTIHCDSAIADHQDLGHAQSSPPLPE